MLAPQPEVPGLATRRIAADILDGVLQPRPAARRAARRRSRSTPDCRRWPIATARWCAGWSPPCCAGSAPCGKLIDVYLDKGLPDDAPRAETVLMLGAAQILWLDVPDHAAVDLRCASPRPTAAPARYAGLVNAVLRRVTQEGTRAASPSSTPSRSIRRTG